jgi:hypothetical protein
VRNHVGMRNRFSVLRYADEPEDLAVPVIDDIPLCERLRERHPGIALDLVVPPSLQWLGAPRYAEDGRAVILDGTCGNAGCCGVMARVDVSPATVVWRDFFARGAPELPGDLRFEFDRAGYEAALATLPDLPSIEWTADEGQG